MHQRLRRFSASRCTCALHLRLFRAYAAAPLLRLHTSLSRRASAAQNGLRIFCLAENVVGRMARMDQIARRVVVA